MSLLRYLLHGSDVLTMPKSWLADTDRLASYEAWTANEAGSRVERDADTMKAENARIVAEREQRLAAMVPQKVLRPQFRSQQR